MTKLLYVLFKVITFICYNVECEVGNRAIYSEPVRLYIQSLLHGKSEQDCSIQNDYIWIV